ncbi:MAG: hypothetical protein Greene041679_391 [Parcubacteria group bacterium Greene0416_79]|nr:MAG: hypothetical protein Greene041679_391 [Parcubacteria group bacterium Greene0416_79]
MSTSVSAVTVPDSGKNHGRIVREVVQIVVATRPFDPITFLGKKWSLVAGEHDARCDTLTKVAFSQVIYETCLKEEELSITGEEKLTRFKANKNIRLGATVFAGLWADYQAYKENSVLERQYLYNREQKQDITYLDFFGDILLDPCRRRGVLCLCRRDIGVWYWDWQYRWLGYGWYAGHHSASLASEDSGLEVKSSELETLELPRLCQRWQDRGFLC